MIGRRGFLLGLLAAPVAAPAAVQAAAATPAFASGGTIPATTTIVGDIAGGYIVTPMLLAQARLMAVRQAREFSLPHWRWRGDVLAK